MSMVLEAEAARATERAARDAERLETERLDVTDALEEIIASHRAALRELAPHQAERAVRRETAWHMAELGLLLGVRDRAAFGARPAAMLAGCAPAAPSNAEEQTPHAKQKAPAELVQHPQGPGENTGTDRRTR